jgi:hypothetical protein
VLRKILPKNAGSFYGFSGDKVREERDWGKIGSFGRICQIFPPG